MATGWYEVRKAPNGQFIFNLKAGNAETILISEQYTTMDGCKNGIASVQSNSGDDSNYERKESEKGKHSFMLKARNHQVIGYSEKYESVSGMENGIKSVMANGSSATIKDKTA